MLFIEDPTETVKVRTDNVTNNIKGRDTHRFILNRQMIWLLNNTVYRCVRMIPLTILLCIFQITTNITISFGGWRSAFLLPTTKVMWLVYCLSLSVYLTWVVQSKLSIYVCILMFFISFRSLTKEWVILLTVCDFVDLYRGSSCLRNVIFTLIPSNGNVYPL
jgi:hypothetical protein